MHVDGCERVEDGGDVSELGPVELQILSRREVRVAAVVGARHVREHAELLGGEQPVRDGDAQHVAVQLKVEAVLQAQRAKLLLGERPCDAPFDLAAKLACALFDDASIVIIILIHE